MPRFIVAYDGSDPSRAAFRCALALAARTTARAASAWSLVLLHVIEPSPDALLAESPALALDPMMPPHMPMGLPTSLVEAEQRQRAWMREETLILQRECEAAGVALEIRIETGSLLDVLEDTPGADDIITVGATGRFRRGGVGSTTKSLVRNAPCPVLVAHADTPTLDITSIACAFDGVPPASDAIALARRLADATALPLSVLAVPRSGASALAPDYATLIAAATPVVGPNAQVVALRPPTGTPITSEPDLIASCVRAAPGTLLIMGAYADSWIRDLLLGSTTAQILSALKAPILLVHDRQLTGPITAD